MENPSGTEKREMTILGSKSLACLGGSHDRSDVNDVVEATHITVCHGLAREGQTKCGKDLSKLKA